MKTAPAEDAGKHEFVQEVHGVRYQSRMWLGPLRFIRRIWALRSSTSNFLRSPVCRSETRIFCSAVPRRPALGRCPAVSSSSRAVGIVSCFGSTISRRSSMRSNERVSSSGTTWRQGREAGRFRSRIRTGIRSSCSSRRDSGFGCGEARAVILSLTHTHSPCAQNDGSGYELRNCAGGIPCETQGCFSRDAESSSCSSRVILARLGVIPARLTGVPRETHECSSRDSESSSRDS